MHKHNDIISRLTDAQKIKMLTSAGDLTGKDLKIMGIPELRVGDMKDYGRELFPNVTALAHCWNEEIWYDVAAERSEMMLRDKVNFIMAPGPRIKLSPYRREVGEDPLLASTLASAHIRAAADRGAVAAASGLYITESDTDWLDKSPDSRAIGELIVSPFRKSVEGISKKAVVTDLRKPRESYAGVCKELQTALKDHADYLVCKKATEENTVELISRGVICLEGSENALKTALGRYKKLKHSIENNGGATESQLNDEMQNYAAISPESIDLALDKLLDLVYDCRGGVQSFSNAGDEVGSITALNSTIASGVLLKNGMGLLPVSKNKKIAVIGGIIFKNNEDGGSSERISDELKSRGFNCIGSAKGYDMNGSETKSDVDAALALAERADVVLLFLGFGYDAEKRIPRTQTLSLPANQLYLADRISAKSGKKVIAVISSGHAADIGFTRPFGALMTLPLEVRYSAEAAASLITGESNPSGKLAYTLYADSDCSFRKASLYRERYGMKTGSFVGYRYYDTAGLTVGYPFGHGLSYTQFRYSSLTVNNGEVSFVVENIGDIAGAETAQVYVGEAHPSVIRPKKELSGFVRVELVPGEKKRVSLPLRFPEIYVGGELVAAGGNYTVYVGSSVSDIRLTASSYCEGERVESDNERLIDYLQSVSNVKEDNFTLEANYSFMKRSIRNILFGVAFVALAISVAVFNSITDSPSLFVGAVAGILAIISVLFFVSEAVERSRAYAEERKRIDEANKQSFEDAEEMPVLSTERMFREEFEEKDERDTEMPEEVVEGIEDGIMLEYVNTDFKIADATEDIKRFFEDRGYRLNGSCAEGILTSLATSGLLMTGGMNSEEFVGFVRLLSEYFGTETFVDLSEKRADGDSHFYSYDYHGDSSKKNLLLALEYARNNPAKMVIAAFDGAKREELEEYLEPFMKYLYSPKNVTRVNVKGDRGNPVSYNISPNFKIVINLDKNLSIDMLPAHIASLAAVNVIEGVKCQTVEIPVSVRELNRYQLDYMAEKEGTKAEVSEEIWKRVDKLEKYAARFSDYRIGNKLWLGFEKHISLLNACGLEMSEAVDIAVSARLIPSMSVAVKDKLTDEDQSLSETAELSLGEDNAECIKRLIGKLVFTYVEEREGAAESDADMDAAEDVEFAEAVEDEEIIEESVLTTEDTVQTDAATEEDELGTALDDAEAVLETEADQAEQDDDFKESESAEDADTEE